MLWATHSAGRVAIKPIVRSEARFGHIDWCFEIRRNVRQSPSGILTQVISTSLMTAGNTSPQLARSGFVELPFFSADSLDDVMRAVFQAIDEHGVPNQPSKGPNRELIGAHFRLSNPLARLSRTEGRGKIFSCLGELCWYLAGRNDAEFISYYIPEYLKLAEDGALYGGYGPRLYGWNGQNQIDNVLALLRVKPDSRRAVIQLFDAVDISVHHEDVPCTCTLQFMVRDNALHMVTNMRSNDAYIGLPHDVFCFTMLQEIVARTLSINLGLYCHTAGSLHLYNKDDASAKRFLKEGWQSTTIMPEMPRCDPAPSIQCLLQAEESLRSGNTSVQDLEDWDDYWADLARLLLIFRLAKNKDSAGVARLRSDMVSQVYDVFIDAKLQSLT